MPTDWLIRWRVVRKPWARALSLSFLPFSSSLKEIPTSSKDVRMNGIRRCRRHCLVLSVCCSAADSSSRANNPATLIFFSLSYLPPPSLPLSLSLCLSPCFCVAFCSCPSRSLTFDIFRGNPSQWPSKYVARSLMDDFRIRRDGDTRMSSQYSGIVKRDREASLSLQDA